MKNLINLIFFFIIVFVSGQTRYQITLKERDLQSTLGKKGVKIVKEITQQYDFKIEDIAPLQTATYQFNELGLLESFEEDITKYEFKSFYKFYYTDSYHKMTLSFKFYKKGSKNLDVSWLFQLYKTNIGYFADKIDESTVEFYANGKLKKVTDYSYNKGKDDIYEIFYNGNKVSKVQSSHTYKFNDIGKESYSFVLYPVYKYYNRHGFLDEDVMYMPGFGFPNYKRYEYKMDNNNNWVSRMEYSRNKYSKNWKLEKITLREIQYNDGTKTGSTNVTSSVKYNAKQKANSLGLPTRDPEKANKKGSSIKTAKTPNTVPENNRVISPKKTTGCVSGDCNNGWGKWNYDNGFYTGFWENGKKSGYGMYNWSKAGKYIGWWKYGEMNGYGIYFYNEKDEMIGEFKNGKLNGYGTSLYNGKWSRGIYKDGNLQTSYTFVINSGIKTGCTIGDCQNKYGRYKWSNGDQFTGFFKNGSMYMGVYKFTNGDKYSGMFNSQNRFHGNGRFFFINGGYYGGQWSNGKYNGRGEYQDINMKTQIGIWTNGTLTTAF
jgi:hypothetical protein